MNSTAITWASGPFDGDMFGTLEVLEQALPVALIATFEPELYTCNETDSASEVLERAEAVKFDHIPVLGEDKTIIGVLHREHAAGSTKHVAAVMQLLHESVLISSNSGILSFVEEADIHPVRLVLKGSHITGIVTLSDLQKLGVRPVLFYRITHVELLIARWLRRHQPNDLWLGKLKPDRQKQINKVWKKKSDANLAIDKLTCTDLIDKIDAILKCHKQQPVFRIIAPEEMLNEVRWLRNAVCHAGDYALTRDNAKRTAKAARLAREVIEDLQTALGLQRDV
jgi:CBS domain-containing protein